MAKDNHELLAFNRGIISPLVMARTDVPRVALSAETQDNWIPRALGAMSLRPGLGYLGASHQTTGTKMIPFVYARDDTALLECTQYILRVWVGGALITRPAVTTAIANSGFTTDLASWTDADETGATSEWLTGGYMSLRGDGTNAAIRYQQVTCAGANIGVEHGVRVAVSRGPVNIRIGSTLGGQEYQEEIELETGTHSLAITPTGDFYVYLLSRSEYPVLVDSCGLDSAGALTLPTPWVAGVSFDTTGFSYLRYTQSGDVVYATVGGQFATRPQKIIRWGTRSWATTDYVSNYGPFRNENLTKTTITPSALNGLVTLTASTPLFKSTHVGALFRLTSAGQAATQDASAADTYTNSVLVTGTGDARVLGLTLSGTWAGTVTLQRSVGVSDNWQDVTTYTANASTTLDDALDNQVIYYRLGVKAAEWTSGTVTMTLAYAGGSITGIARVSAYTSPTAVTAYVVKDFGSLDATDSWAEGAWSPYRGYPTACVLREGRLWLAGKDKFWGSVVDDFTNHDPDYIGDAGPISRSIGEGPVDSIQWLASVGNLIAGGEGAEFLARSSTQEEPFTPSNFNVRPISTLGSAPVDAVVLDGSILFVDTSTTRIQELTIDGGSYSVGDLTLLTPETMTAHKIIRVVVQRRPDVRVHCVLGDGTVAMLVYNPAENVRAWVTVSTTGYITDAVVLPGTVEDDVYYVVDRELDGGSTLVTYLEKWAKISDCVGGTLNRQADSYVAVESLGSATIPGLDHLEGLEVVCWADGVDQGTFTVTAGGITLPAAVDDAIVGLAYSAQFKSTKLASTGISLISRKRIAHLGILLTDTHAQGVQFGPDFDTLDGMPIVEAGESQDQDGIWAAYNYDHISFRGAYTVDSRLCLKATAPRPATILAVILEMEK